MTQRNLLASYIGLMTIVSSTLGGYVACGAQKYRVAIHGDEAENSGKRPSTVSKQEGAAQTAAVNSLAGVHSSRGWGQGAMIHFKVSKDISGEVVKELQLGMETWEAAIGKKLFVFDGVEEKVGEEFPDLYAPLSDSINGHYFDFNWTKKTGKSSTVLATTIWENGVKDPSKITKADIRYNNEFYIFGDSVKDHSQGQRLIVDMQSLALHELGHLLGLSHVSQTEDRYSVMNTSLFIGEGMITRRLSDGDIERIRSVYGIGDATLAAKLEKADDFPIQN